MQSRLREVMLQAEGAGQLAGDDVQTGEAEHPVCGDLVQVDCRLQDGCIQALRWRAQGCPATMAVAAAAPRALLGNRPQDAGGLLSQQLRSLGGLEPAERHAERIFLLALARATGQSDGFDS